MEVFKCPICGSILSDYDKYIKCSNNHAFDKSKSGYVNLLIKNNCKNHGDNKLMIKSRNEFLNKGYYDKLQQKICQVVKKYSLDNGILLDCGCGEGYYTNTIEINTSYNVIGIDISKDAINIASKGNKNVDYAVASAFDVPLDNEAVNLLTTIFAPLCISEFKRLIKRNGILVMVIPLENHLFSLKKAIYDEPYKNEPADTQIDGFQFLEQFDVKYNINIDNNNDIQNLFMMTPYYYKTSEKDQAKLNDLCELSTDIEFGILVYKKI